jgi:hypothetical protein
MRAASMSYNTTDACSTISLEAFTNFMTLFGSAGVAWALAARAQQDTSDKHPITWPLRASRPKLQHDQRLRARTARTWFGGTEPRHRAPICRRKLRSAPRGDCVLLYPRQSITPYSSLHQTAKSLGPKSYWLGRDKCPQK